MYIRGIRIQNVKGFVDVDIDFSRSDGSFSGWTVIAGRNGSGKSTLLKALALTAAGPTAARSLQESFADWIRVGHGKASVEVLVVPTFTDLISSSSGQKGSLWHHLSEEPVEASVRARLLWSGANKGKEPELSTGSIKGIPDIRASKPRPDYISPRNKVELMLAAIWIQLLSFDQVGAYDNFFDLGGHSLLATQLVSRIRESFGVELPLMAVFEFQTLTAMASEIIRLIGLWANAGGWFIAGYGPYRRLTGHATDAQRLMEGSSPIARLVSLFREDASLIESVNWLRELYLRRLEGRPGAAELEMAVISLLNDGLLPSDVYIEGIDSEGLWARQGSVRLPLQELSDGYRTIAALVMDIVRQLERSFGTLQAEYTQTENGERLRILHDGAVLIDEADLHLHISWQKRLGFWLKSHFPRIQFIVTTHSPFVCQAADSRGLIRLPAPGENRSAEHVSEALFNTVVNGGADDAVLTELFGLDTPYSGESERLRKRIAHLEALLQSGKVSDKERKELKELRSRLPQTLSGDVEQALRTLAINE